MITKTLFPGRYIQGFGAIGRLEKELLNLGKTGLCIMAPSAMKLLKDKISEQTAKLRLIYERFNRECCDREIERLATWGGNVRPGLSLPLVGAKPLTQAR